MSFIKKHWLILAAIPVCVLQPELIPLIGAAVVAKLVSNLSK